MGKAHRDNHAARLKRGDASFALKNKRRSAVKKRTAAKCRVCGGFFKNRIPQICGIPACPYIGVVVGAK